MKSKTLLSKLLAAGISVFVALSCVAMAACGNDNADSGNGNEQTDNGGDITGGDENNGTTGGDQNDDTTGGNENDDTTGGNEDDNPGEGDENQGQTPDEGDEGEDTKPAEDTSAPLPAGNKIYLVGDSTVCSFNDDYYMPRYGYGTQIADFFNVTSDQIVNLAISGRSSLSFLSESNYNTLKNSIGEGDYLIIGFGHNDEKDDDATRYTNPQKSYTDETTADGPSFQYTLYENYIKLAEDKGATPILCTPIVRYAADSNYTGNVVHNTDKGDYSQAIRTLGAETNTTVIDLTTITKELYLEDNAAAKNFHACTTYEGEKPNETASGLDSTHLNKYGAKMVAYQFAQAILESDSSLKTYARTNSAAPDDPSVAVNQSYVRPDYKAPALSTLTPIATLGSGENRSVWYKTAMGNLGGNKAGNFSATYDSAKNTFTVSNSATNGKIEETDAGAHSDGFGAAFMRVSKNDNFTITATATISGGTAGNRQTAFGIMLRDDMYIDTNMPSLATNYITAGMLLDGTAIFSRENKILTKGEKTAQPAEGDVYELSLERNGQNITVSVKKQGGTAITKTYYDFDLVAVDNDYMYICLITNRGLSVEYSNVNYTYTGEYGGA